MPATTITRASFTLGSNEEVVVRNRTRAIGLIAFSAVTAGAILIGAIVAIAKGNSSAAFVGTPIEGVVFYVCWVIGWRSTIRLRPEGIVVENCVIRYMVPWRLGRQFVVSQGIKLRLLDGRMIATLAAAAT
ncbi:hypothetical protein ABH920_004844 [Catenulispora sp. EB89]|uniref:hypothetical protein n=1 Tax=Catenulispora sp. EB89 TaxID=3156257 RepID=UPI00351341BA